MKRRRTEREHDSKTQRAIKEYGWQVTCVLEELPDYPGFGYTVGLTETWNHPEVIVFDLLVDDANGVLNALARVVQGGTRLEAGMRIPDILEGVDVEIRAVLPRWRDEYLLGACTRYGVENFDAVQCVWPDQEGRFPGEFGADAEFLRFQPILASETQAN
jgi:hypothetical protein